MKQPNGYGSITKLSGRRRKPWIVRVTSGREYDTEKQDYRYKRVTLGYYSSYAEANKSLVDYNENPYSLEDNNLTFGEIYKKWSLKNYPTLSKSSIASRDMGLRYCESIKDYKIKDITYSMLQNLIDECPHGSATKSMIKTVMNTVFDYAVKDNLVSKNYASYITIDYSEPTYERKPFTDAEIKNLWKHSDKWDYRFLLILIYSGLRVNELLKNTIDNVNLEERWIYVPQPLAKNTSSIRYVPIHDKVYDFVCDFVNNPKRGDTQNIILNDSGTVITYNNFVSRNLKRMNKDMGCEHRFHDTRHTFATLGHRYKMDDLILQKILGHTPTTITQKVYTHISIEQMIQELKKIKI